MRGEWTAVYAEYGSTRMIRTPAWKYVERYPEGPHELWDLVNDPGERHNLIDDQAHRRKLRYLRRRLRQWFSNWVDPDMDGLKQQVSSRGQLRPLLPDWEGRGRAFDKRPAARETQIATYGQPVTDEQD